MKMSYQTENQIIILLLKKIYKSKKSLIRTIPSKLTSN